MLATRAVLAAAALVPFLAPAAHAQPAYIFTNVIDSTMDASINGRENLAIDGATIAVHNVSEIFKVEGGVRTTIVKVGDPVPNSTILDLGFDLEDFDLSGGTVAFAARYGPTHHGIFTGSGGPLTTIARDGDMTADGALELTFSPPPAISGDTVAYSAIIQFYGNAVLTSSGGTQMPLVKAGDPASSMAKALPSATCCRPPTASTTQST
jgi:hypothetical protein